MLSLSANLIELGFDSIADNDGCCCSLLEGLTAVHLATYSASLTRCPAGSLSPKNILVIKNDRAKTPKNNRTISVAFSRKCNFWSTFARTKLHCKFTGIIGMTKFLKSLVDLGQSYRTFFEPKKRNMRSFCTFKKGNMLTLSWGIDL